MQDRSRVENASLVTLLTMNNAVIPFSGETVGISTLMPGAEDLALLLWHYPRYVKGTERNKGAAIEPVRLEFQIPPHNGITKQEQSPTIATPHHKLPPTDRDFL